MNLPDFLSSDELGGVRLTGHRIALYHLLWHYNEGYSPEMLLEQFPTLSMALIHKVLAFYWENKAEVDAYLAQVQERLDQQRSTGTQVDVAALRERLANQQHKVAS